MNEAQDIFRNILTCVALVFASGVLFAIYQVGGGQLVARLGAAFRYSRDNFGHHESGKMSTARDIKVSRQRSGRTVSERP
jgi:hypothetical protein